MMTKITTLLALLVLVGCQSSSAWIEEPLLFDKARPGHKVKLLQSLSLPAYRARVALQGGRPVSAKELDRYYPHCEFEVRTLHSQTITLEPDEFQVVKVLYDQELFTQGAPIRLASTDGGGDTVLFYTRMTVSSPKQPDVLYFTCGHIENVHIGWHLSYRKFQQAVGSVVSLRP